MKRKYILVCAAAVVFDALVFISRKAALFPDLIHGGTLPEITSKVVWCVLFDILMLMFGIKAQAIFDLPYEVVNNRGLVWDLSKNDFKVRYVGSYLGIFWAFINPLVTIVLYWVVFQFAFHSTDVDGQPFVLWLIAGLVPWFLIQDSINNGAMALMEYSYLVKKVLFKISVLPAVKVFSSCFIHLAFMIITMLIYILLGHYPDVYWFQLIYYFACAVVFTLALAYATSAIQPFVRDLSQFITVFLQVFMWATPIMWNVDMVPAKFLWIFKINPAFYIVTGYRDSLLFNVGIFEHMGYMLYFWVLMIILLLIGSNIFRKLKPHFADVL